MSLRLDADTRARAAALKAALRTLQRPAKEAARQERKADRKSRPKRERRVAEPKREKVDDGAGYMSWLHDDLPCIACLVLGQTLPPSLNGIEAAHQKLQLADRGFHRRAGRRGPHWTCVPLCRLHHREGPLCCDPAQAKFWSIIGLLPEQLADFIEALNAAYREGRAGLPIIHRFGDLAARNRARPA